MVVGMTTAIAASGLRKAFGDKIVLDGIDLEVREGTVFSLLGPNGAGKTTAVNVLTTLMKADGGTVRVAGHDVATETKAVRAVIGVTGQFAAVDDLLTGQENLQLMADLHHLRAGEGKRVADGATVFLTTQYLEEADQLSDRIAVLDQGRLVAEGTPGDLKRQVPGSHVRLRSPASANSTRRRGTV
jgi:ABC-type multidrug transport system ATPase subunit